MISAPSSIFVIGTRNGATHVLPSHRSCLQKWTENDESAERSGRKKEIGGEAYRYPPYPTTSAYHHRLFLPHRTKTCPHTKRRVTVSDLSKTRETRIGSPPSGYSPDARHVLAHLRRIRALQLAQLRVPLDLEEHFLARGRYDLFHRTTGDERDGGSRSQGEDMARRVQCPLMIDGEYQNQRARTR